MFDLGSQFLGGRSKERMFIPIWVCRMKNEIGELVTPSRIAQTAHTFLPHWES
jgi:hypothetical protein